MQEKSVKLSVPAEPRFARLVRMTAANLAVLCGLGVDEVEDLRMIAEEGFVYSCATKPSACDISFECAADHVTIDFALGSFAPVEEGEEGSLSLVELLLDAVCDEFEVTDANMLHLTRKIGDANA
ncbi:MAG: ATP-binding protein [Olsenella sp.]|nr:ATP-binding protein [Olsenella sp.]